MRKAILLTAAAIFFSCQVEKQQFDLIIRGGTIYNGLGGEPFTADVGVNGDTIAFVGNLADATAREEIDAKGRAVSPGFINMLSWADGSLLNDGRSMSDIKQGVTLEVFGEGWSPGPRKRQQKDTLWRTLGEYFQCLERKKASPNFASFVGATSVRNYVLEKE
ncbi:MAG TPA: hypothetical protein VKQ08_12650, partial [Cyclobacteriaceae bacterium]|nr:hypothetical protein [Cyclobacteriaceae bacterium]